MFIKNFFSIIFFVPVACSAVVFNVDVIDAADRKNIDLSVFSKLGNVSAGRYILGIKINNTLIPELPIIFYSRKSVEEGADACITPDVVAKLGLRSESTNLISYWNDGECADFSELKGVNIRSSINNGYIAIDVPLAYVEHLDWISPALWDDGLPSIILDYSATAYESRIKDQAIERNLSAYGTVGVNLGPWRFRGGFQGGRDLGEKATSSFDWSRFYAYRALPSISSNLTIGDNYIGSDLFDSFSYKGIGLSSDDRMLPPALQGYAPEVRGIAKTNAKVTISQKENILYESVVPAGPFIIQELNSGVRGQLDVTVLEQDGSIQTFSVDTATVPYLTRPGSVRYKAAVGQTSVSEYSSNEVLFGSGEFSLGMSNSWSLFGGSIFSEKYYALALGIGRDLYNFGALSLDITRSAANLSNDDYLQGYSYRLNYSKRFDEINSDISFAGYRFSERNFMNMSEFLESNKSSSVVNKSKSMYTVRASKGFLDFKTSVYATYNYQDYWNSLPKESINLSISKQFNYWLMKGMSANLSFSRNVSKNSSSTDNLLSLNLSIPIGHGSSMTYSQSKYSDVNSHHVGYSNNQNKLSNWQIAAGIKDQTSGSAEYISGYYANQGSIANTNLSISHQSGESWSASATVSGGVTIASEGAALHKQGTNGGTRLMLDTGGVSGVAVNDGSTQSNYWGKAVVGDANSYTSTTASIDVNKLADDVEVLSPVVEATLTEGAVGYRKLSVQQGMKVMTSITLPDGKHLPFGVEITDSNGRTAGLVSDAGMAYLSGINSGTQFTASWSDTKCRINIKENYTEKSIATLTCVPF